MAHCYRCGALVEPADRFCMDCGAPAPAHPQQAHVSSQPAAPVSSPPAKATTPTWLPVDPSQQLEAAHQVPGIAQGTSGPASTAASPGADTLICPRCSARLPAYAHFCGDCGLQLRSTPGAAPRSGNLAPASHAQPEPFRLASAILPQPPAAGGLPAALPDPIPLAPPIDEKPAIQPAKPVLPPFRASAWALEPTPDVEIPDTTWTLSANEEPTPAPAHLPPWEQGTPAQPPEPASHAQPVPPWPPAALGPGAATSFPAATAQPYGAKGANPVAPAMHLQPPGAPPPVKPRSRYPRGQVITMIVAAIVTVVAAIAGVIVQFFLPR